MAISLPVRAGYGLPLLYFAIHGALVLVERALGRGLGRVWTLAALALPLPLLFHRPFLEGIVWQLVGIEPGS
jgi:alginate O-acetyltransferase complex protein AlgI